MNHFQKLVVPALLLTGLLFTACTSSLSPQNDYMYKGINFGSDRDVDFRQGVRDGCKTADGYYTKNHTLFKSNESYRVGWEDGRIQCKGK
jgi:hypothetical protein